MTPNNFLNVYYSVKMLKILLGCMMSGKTTKIIKECRDEYFLGKKVVYVNSTIDSRSENGYSTHNPDLKNQQQPFDMVKISELFPDNFSKYDVIAIDEGNFHKGLVDCVLCLLEQGKTVLVAGLDGNFLRQPFGEISSLIPHADIVEKITGKCQYCVNSSVYTMRIGSNNEEILIGGSEYYAPVCRKCYELQYGMKLREIFPGVKM